MKRLRRSVLVGRGEEVSQLESILGAVKEGGGRCVLISGEAGIGKSRLLAEIGPRAEQLNFRVLSGRCFEQDRSIPYAPLSDMLRPFFGESVNRSEAPVPLTTELAKLLPEVASHFSLSAPASLPETRVDRRRLFEGVNDFFWQQAAAGPLLLTIEDLHWSDQASLEYLLFLVRQMAEKPILLLLTSRAGRGQRKLTQLLAGLDREPIAQEMRLKALSRAEVAALIKGMLEQAQEPSAAFVASIYRLSEGNPFFAEEICSSLIASGDVYYVDGQWQRKPLAQIDIPDSIQRVVERQVSRIGAAARRLIEVAAVSGRSFDFGVMQALTGHSDGELLALVKELMAAGLVVEESVDRFAFRHALTREALYGQLLMREREGLHGQVVEAIEAVHADLLESQVEALAYHSYEAGLWKKTATYSQQAGEKALRLFAPHAAVEHFTRAVEARGRLGQGPSSLLYRLRGQAFDTLGKFEEARADYEAALEVSRGDGDEEATWQLLLDLGLLWAARDYERTGAYCRQALELARTMDDGVATGHSLNRLGNWLMNSGRAGEALAYHREALDLFEGLKDRAGIAETLDLLAMSANQSGDFEGTVSYYERAIPILRELENWQTLSSSLANLAVYTLEVERAEEAVRLAREIGWHAGEAYALNNLSMVHFSRGRYGEALILRRQSLEMAEAIEHPQWMAANHLYLGFYYMELLAPTRAKKHLEAGVALAKQIGSTFFSWMGSGWLASVTMAQGDVEAAEALLAELPQAWIPTLYSVRLARVEVALAEDDGARALQLLDDVLKMMVVIERARGVVQWFGPALALEGRALLVLDRPDEAEAVLRRAVTLYTGQGIAAGLWRICLVLGACYLAAGRREEAREMFARARTQIEELAATIDDVDLREGFLRGAGGMVPAMRPPTARQAAKQEYGGLTRRERQVAGVVAQGLTNQEIADELVVSIKTVEAHVTRILSKLGFSSRAQIAAWAVDKGLAAAPEDLDGLSRVH